MVSHIERNSDDNRLTRKIGEFAIFCNEYIMCM